MYNQLVEQNISFSSFLLTFKQVLPSAHRGTGNGIAIGWNRVMGILSAVIATVADVRLLFLFSNHGSLDVWYADSVC
jgi:hypothetical protein